jgi:hypothetical protein
MLIALKVDFHVDCLPIFNSLAYPQLKLLKKPTLSTAVLHGVACGGFLSVRYKKSLSVTDYKEFPGRVHFTIGQRGWEELADYVISWLKAQNI